MIRCEACGTENSPEAVYCSQCARKLDAATREKIIQTRAAHTATGIKVTTVLMAAVIVIVVVVLVVLVTTGVL
ncbi:MAG: DUF7577 domain-containing protein [Chloroflexota bacterium]